MWDRDLSAIVVPHHLEVPDLIAKGIALAQADPPERIVLLFPDHFDQTGRGFATTARDFETVYGTVPNDQTATQHLISEGLPESCLFAADHGIGALLPFIAHYLPGVPILPIALSIHSRKPDWDRLARQLAPLITPATLIVQSTDFSHYLPHHEARLRDQQVLNILAAGDEDALLRLHQPDHVDSLAALYLTHRLAQGSPLVLANRNQQEVTPYRLAETTSYMVIAYTSAQEPMARPFINEQVLVIGGDLFLGRQLPQILSDELAEARVLEAALAATGGIPLMVNLEGVVLEEVPTNLQHLTLVMPEDVVSHWLARLNVVAVGLANNHAADLGETGLAATRDMLDRAGISHVAHGEARDVAGLVVVGLRDISNREPPFTDLIARKDLDALIQADGTRPVVAFFHWGREGMEGPSDREWWLAAEAKRRGASVIIGAHPHKASGRPQVLDGGDAILFWSLGNFLFDQTGPEVSGALVELRIFPQGTIFARQLALPNLFDIALGREPIR
ncbi:MAG: AmmeMemoRadiSam system protein B [Roseinatronobacter sp.]